MGEENDILIYNNIDRNWSAEPIINVNSNLDFNSHVEITAEKTTINGNLTVNGDIIINGILKTTGNVSLSDNSNIIHNLKIENGYVHINNKIENNPAKIGLFILHLLDETREETETIINIQQIY